MIAMGMSSNAIGTVNNFQFIKEIIENRNILFFLMLFIMPLTFQ